ncbi:MAG TPA: plastocyanin/azurin family copper-binding protein [Ktedonobacteraceae bacterium]|jgi:plastocyanin
MKTLFRGRQTWLETGLQKEIIPTPREHVSSEFHHTSFFSRKCGLHSLRGAISLLALLTIAAGFWLSPTQYSLAKPKAVKDLFSVFCQFYYNDGKDSDAAQDTQVCQGESSAFDSLLNQEVPQGIEQWPAKASLDDLAKQKLLSTKDKTPIQSQQDFANSITDADLKALISGSGNAQKKIPQDSQFLPTLWDYNSTFDTSPNPGTSSPPKQAEVDIVEQGEGNYLFKPATLQISKGTEVVWKNLSDGKHTITSHGKGPLSIDNITQQNQQVSFVFNSVGIFAYFCKNHPKTMQAIVIVTPPTASISPSPATSTPSVPQQEVDIVEQGEGNYLFKPASLTISKGTKVVWKNLSDGKHTITSRGKGPLNINNITQQNQQVSFVFNSVGTFAYFCQNHPKTMQATIIVTDPSSTPKPS